MGYRNKKLGIVKIKPDVRILLVVDVQKPSEYFRGKLGFVNDPL